DGRRGEQRGRARLARQQQRACRVGALERVPPQRERVDGRRHAADRRRDRRGGEDVRRARAGHAPKMPGPAFAATRQRGPTLSRTSTEENGGMRQLTSLDAQFLAVESARTYGHVGGLAVYDPSTAPGGSFGVADVC